MFTRIAKILPESVEKSGLAPKLARARVFSIFEERARAILPAPSARAFKILNLESGTLTIACKTSSAAYVLKAAEIELRAGLEEEGIEHIRFLLTPWR